MSEQNEMAEKVLEYLERSFTDPSFRPIMDGDLEIVMSGKMPEQYVGVSDVFEAITQFANALTAKGRESFTPMELQLTLFTLIADVVTDKDVVEVVRCKDCRHYTPWSDNHDYGYGICDFHDGENVINRGFCSEGKRKEGESNEPDQTTRESILEAAKQCVCTDREGQYGSPEDNFALIAKLWSEFLRATGLGDGSDEWDLISADEVAVMMCLLKIARIAPGEPKADSWIDLAGYAACGGEIQAKQR